MKDRTQLYKHLMNGFSFMIPFVVAGGIFLVLATLPLFEPVALWMEETGTVTFQYILPILAGYIAYSIADRPGILPGFVAGALALNGDSGFIGAILGGFAAGYSVELIKILTKRIPRSIISMKTILILPILGLLFASLSMVLINFLFSPISIALEREIIELNGIPLIIVSLIAGALMAFDLGGPINKIVYLIGVIAIFHAHSSILMAAIMAAGMTPPLGIALATLLFKNLYTEEEIKQGQSNWITGASFITEGAIPFYKKNPKVVRPALIIGSSLAAVIVALFGVSVPAPHGGIFVVFLMTNWWGFLIALSVGTLASALYIGIFMKETDEFDVL
ncbi:MAG: fructose-specific PTS transporter subunit EIIC [Acholeplasmataceae bacterium]|nr:fructose-specific PTS transporter subunit EIIC [Acholeplasmataceae bacterium]